MIQIRRILLVCCVCSTLVMYLSHLQTVRDKEAADKAGAASRTKDIHTCLQWASDYYATQSTIASIDLTGCQEFLNCGRDMKVYLEAWHRYFVLNESRPDCAK